MPEVPHENPGQISQEDEPRTLPTAEGITLEKEDVQKRVAEVLDPKYEETDSNTWGGGLCVPVSRGVTMKI